MSRGKIYNKFYTDELWAKVNKENKLILDDFLAEYRQRKMKPGTISGYKNDLRIILIYILMELDNKCILNLKKKDFRGLSLFFTENCGMSPARTNRLKSALNSMLTFCEEDDDYEYEINYAKKVKGIPRERVKDDEDDFFFTFDEFIKVRDILIERGKLQYAILWSLGFDSAGRKNELFQVEKHGLLDGNKTNIVVSDFVYTKNGMVSNSIDYMQALLCLDRIIACTSKRNKQKSKNNKELMRATLKTIDDKSFVKGIIYPQKNDGSIVNKKLYSSSNLKLTETVNIKLPENKEFKEIEDGLIFSLSPKTGFTDNISGTKLAKNGSVNIVQKYFKFGQDGALILENFKVPEVITIQYLVDKTNVEDNKMGYITYFKKSTNDKIKLISVIQKKTDMNCRYVYQAGTPIGNAIYNPNVVEKNTNDLLDCMTFTIDFKTGRIIVYANGIITWGTQISNIPKSIDTTTKKPCYLDNLRNLLTMDTLIIGNNASLQKGAETLDIYDIRIFDRELTPTEVVQNTSALMCNAQIKEEENNMAIESKDLLVAIKAFSRANALPLDASSVHGSQELANTYAKQANAYGGQIITAKVDGKFKAFVLQGENGNCTIEPIGADPSALKQYVIVGTRPESGQQQGTIYIDNNVGYIWDGAKWVKIFEDVSASITDFQKRITKIEKDINLKANVTNANFTGTVKLEGKDLATKEYAESLVNAAKSEVPIVIDGDHPFPSTTYKAGQKYVVALAGTYLGQKCEIGDLILIVKDYNSDSHSNADGIVLQSNIDGAVTSAEQSSIDGEIVVMSGATGKVIKSSKINMTALSNAIAKVHEHANKAKLDTYTKTQTELLAEASQDAQNKVDTLKQIVDGKADKATTLDGYGIENAYNKIEIDAKLKVITDNVNTKVDTATVDSKINTAKVEAIAEAAKEAGKHVQERLGAIPITKTVKEYVDEVAGAGGSDVSQQIQNALNEAKEYTNTCLTVVQF